MRFVDQLWLDLMGSADTRPRNLEHLPLETCRTCCNDGYSWILDMGGQFRYQSADRRRATIVFCAFMARPYRRALLFSRERVT